MAKAATPWGPAELVEELTLAQRAGEKRFSSVVQLLETPGGALRQRDHRHRHVVEVADPESRLLEQHEGREDQRVQHGGGREQERTLVTGRSRHGRTMCLRDAPRLPRSGDL